MPKVVPALGAGCEAPTLFWSKPLRRSFWRDRSRQRSPSGQDAGARPGYWSAPRSGLSHYWIAAIFRSQPSHLRPSAAPWPWQQPSTVRILCRSATRCLSKSRAKGPRSPGIRMARRTGTVRPGTRELTVSTLWPSSTVALRQTGCGSCRAPIKSGISISRSGLPRRARSACRMPFPWCVIRVMWSSPTGNCCTVRLPITSPDWRVTVNFGFHRRASVLGVTGGGVHSAPAVYDEERIRTRSRVIGYAIDARQQRFPDETPFPYKPFAESGRALLLGRRGQSQHEGLQSAGFQHLRTGTAVRRPSSELDPHPAKGARTVAPAP